MKFSTLSTWLVIGALIMTGIGCNKQVGGLDVIQLRESNIGVIVGGNFSQDAKYEVRQDGDRKMYYFSSASLEADDANCAAKNGPLGVIVVSVNEPQAEGPIAKPDNIIKVGDRYVYYIGPQTTCTTDPKVQQIVDTEKKWIAEGKFTSLSQ